jgi:PKD repeat protein
MPKGGDVNQRYSRILLVICAVLMMTSASLFAQGWAMPAKTPNTLATCTACPGSLKNKPAVGYAAPIAKFTGRFLDSSLTVDYQVYYRTARAETVQLSPDGKRLYFRIGSGVMAYDAANFITRLNGNETLIDAAGIPTSPPNQGAWKSRPYEQLLQFDTWFYPEWTSIDCLLNPGGTCWQIERPKDGQDRLSTLDLDDQGYVYMAYEVFGWGIAKDPGGAGGALMASQVQVQSKDLEGPTQIFLFKNAGRYYTLVTNRKSSTLLYEVTNRSAPAVQPLRAAKNLYSIARDTTWTKIAYLTDDGYLSIYDSQDIVNGGSPLLAPRKASDGLSFNEVASDGTNFYALSGGTGANMVFTVFSPSGNTYVQSGQYSVPNGFAAHQMRYNAGYLVVSGTSIFSGWENRVFKLQGTKPVELIMPPYYDGAVQPITGAQNKSYIRAYYGNPPAGYIYPGGEININDGMVIRQGSKDYLIICARGLGDVYEITGTDGITAAVTGRSGTANPHTPASAGTTPVYGDPVTFSATGTGSTASIPIQWNFGNPLALVDPNIFPSFTGTSVTHQYSGDSVATGTAVRTVTATSTSDSTIVGSTTLQLKAPVARFGLTGFTTLVTAPAANSSLPIVVGDTLFDASDGTIQSHYATWVIDGVETRGTPAETPAVGVCAAHHNLSFDAHYGPYSGTGAGVTARNGADFAVGIHGSGSDFGYSVRPFAASVAVTSDATNVTFTSNSRVTGDTAALSAAQAAALTYKWELMSSANAVLLAGPTGTAAVSAIPAWNVPKTSFGGLGIHGRLTITSPALLVGSCAGLSFETSSFDTPPLNGPDPVITGDCTAGGPPCVFTATSGTNVDQIADGWTYAWSATPTATVTASNSNTKIWSPTFTAVGPYTVSLTVTNALGFSKTVTKPVTVTSAGSLCGDMVPGTNAYISFSGPSTGCNANSGTCFAGENVAFNVEFYNYFVTCAPHTYTWTFPDGSHAATKTASKSFNAAGTYSVSVLVSNGSQSVTLTANVTVGTPAPPPPPPPPPPGACETMSNNNIFIVYGGPQSNCSYVSTTPCSTAETVSFNASPSGYAFSCANHTFSWSFGDGGTGTGISTTHKYTTGGTYPVSVTIRNGSQTFTAQAQLTVSGGGGGGTCGTMTTSNIFAQYSGAASGCSSGNPSASCTTGESVSFSAGSSSYVFSCATHTYSWDFGDGHTGTGAAPAHQYTAAGNYTATVTINSPTQSVIVSTPVKVGNGNPGNCGEMTANKLFIVYSNASGTCSQASPTSRCQTGELVSFNVDISNYNLACATHTFSWDFGDGTTGTGRTVQHRFNAERSYTVKATVNNGASTLDLTSPVQVFGLGTGPTVHVDFTISPIAGVTNGYIFTPIVDHDGIVTKWVWDFGDNSGTQTVNSSTPSPQSHIYSSAGPHTITLRVEDGTGALAQTDHTIGLVSRTRRAAH